MAEPATEATNTPAAEDIRTAVSEIEDCHRELLSELGSYRQRCRTIRETIASIFDTAKEHGINKKALRALLREREHERKAEEARAGLEDDEQNHFDMLKEKLGDFANTPLGQSALARQGDLIERVQ